MIGIMIQSYKAITRDIASQIKLIMTDIDGTMTSNNKENSIAPEVLEAVKRLEKTGLIVGLVSGRTHILVDNLAGQLGINGPLISENGALARLKPGADFLDLGYTRKAALDALKILSAKYPGRIREREDNAVRLIDAVFFPPGVPTAELAEHLSEAQLLDSGYILHVMQKGISKGETLVKLLKYIENGPIKKSEVMVLGDSITDRTLFENFKYGILVPNSKVPAEDIPVLHKIAGYVTDKTFGEGFLEAAEHIIKLRSS
jgi:phosphoglycolate phosphatase